MKQLVLFFCTMIFLGNASLASADKASDTDKLLNWAESNYPQYFPAHQATQNTEPWLFRFYPETNAYVGVNTSNDGAYVFGGPWGDDNPTYIDSLSNLLPGTFLSCVPIHDDRSTAFFYGRPVPVNFLSRFKQVVVEPENMKINDLDYLHAKGIKVFAYIGVGEINRTRSWYSEIPKDWFMGSHVAWGSDIVDLTQEGWHDYLIDNYMASLWKEGYREFFLDTLDSYQRVVADPDGRLIQEKALVQLIMRINQHFPGVNLILNRGFEILPEVEQYAIALAAESLFQGWDQSKEKYLEVTETDRNWLLDKLNKARDQYGLQIIVIDYVDSNQMELAQKTAEQISDLNFTPWVANPGLNFMGVGECA